MTTFPTYTDLVGHTFADVDGAGLTHRHWMGNVGDTLDALGTIATQNANAVTITGGSVTGITDITVADGGTGASTASGARTNLGLVIGTDVQPFDSDLATIAGLTATTDNFIVSVSSAWASRTPAQVRTTLGLVVGTNVQAWDTDLDALAGVTYAADTIAYFTGAHTAAAATLTSFGRSLIDDTNAAAALATLGLDADLATFALPGSTTISAYGASLVDDADATTARGTLGLGTIATQNANAVAITGGTLATMTSVQVGTIQLSTSAAIPMSASGGVSSEEGPLGATFFGTQWGTKCRLDLRRINGTHNGTNTAIVSGDALAGFNVGAATDVTAGVVTLDDVAHFHAVATENYSISSGHTQHAGARWDFYVNPNNAGVAAVTSKSVALRLDQDGSLNAGFGTYGAVTAATFVVSNTGNVTAPNVLQLDGTFNTVTGFAGSFGCGAFATSPVLTLRRAQGSAGSEAKVTNTQQLAAMNFSGYNDSSATYLVGAVISAVAEQDFTTTGYRGSGLRFWTATSSVNGAAAIRLILDNAGKLWGGATTGAANWYIDQAGALQLASVNATGTITAAGQLTASGALVAQTTLNVTGLTTMTGGVGGGLTIAGDCNISNVLTVTQGTVGNVVESLISTATNDDPTRELRQYRGTSTTGTQFTLGTITLPASTTTMVDVVVLARRTGGSSGSADDGAGYVLRGVFQNGASIGVTSTVIGENVAGWDAVMDYSSNTARIRCTGATTTNITWHAHAYVMYVGS